jgi:hypothetical protein
MCCETHDLRDFLTRAHGGDDALAELLAPADNRRCRCTELGKWAGEQCRRLANGEDVLCDWCRVTDHMRWYETALRGGDPVVSAYYEQRGAVTFGPSGSGALSGKPPEGPFRIAAGEAMRVLRDADLPGEYILEEAPGWGDPAAVRGPVIPAGKIDFRFEFSAEEIAAMRAASGGDGAFGLRSMRIDLQQEMTAEQVMGYVRRRFGV